jgi:hypothetical protein
VYSSQKAAKLVSLSLTVGQNKLSRFSLESFSALSNISELTEEP